MSDHFWLTQTQIERLKPYFPRAHGVPRVDDLRVLSSIIHVLKRGLQSAASTFNTSSGDAATECLH